MGADWDGGIVRCVVGVGDVGRKCRFPLAAAQDYREKGGAHAALGNGVTIDLAVAADSPQRPQLPHSGAEYQGRLRPVQPDQMTAGFCAWWVGFSCVQTRTHLRRTGSNPTELSARSNIVPGTTPRLNRSKSRIEGVRLSRRR